MFPWIPNPIDILTAPLRAVSGALTSAGAALIREAFDWIVGLLLSGVAWLFNVVWDFVSTSTTPDLYASWFAGGPYRVVSTLAVSFLMLTVTLAIAEGIWNRDGAGLLRSVAQDLPKAMFLLTGLLFITTLAIALADAITNAFLGVFGGGIDSFTESLTSVDNELAFGAGLFVILLLAFVLVVVLGIVALELIIREGFILLLVAITAIVIVFDVYRPTRGAAGRAGRLLAGVIAAKPIIALCFAIGGAALGSVQGPSPADEQEAVAEPGDDEAAAAPDGIVAVEEAAAGGEDAADLGSTSAALLAGLATMTLAAFAPFMVLKLFPVADATASDGARSAITSKAAGTASMAAGAVAGGPAGAAAGAAAAGGGGSGGGGGAGADAGAGAAAGMAGGG